MLISESSCNKTFVILDLVFPTTDLEVRISVQDKGAATGPHGRHDGPLFIFNLSFRVVFSFLDGLLLSRMFALVSVILATAAGASFVGA